MHELFFEIGNYAIWIFVVTSIAAMGLNLTIPEVLAPWKKKQLLSISLVANFVVVPLFALFILYLFPLDIDLATRLIIVAAAAGAPLVEYIREVVLDGLIAQAQVNGNFFIGFPFRKKWKNQTFLWREPRDSL